MYTETTCFSKQRKMGLLAQCQTTSINWIVLVISVHPSTNAGFPVPNAGQYSDLIVYDIRQESRYSDRRLLVLKDRSKWNS